MTALQSLQSYDPWWNCWNTIFGSERTQWDVFPSLEVSEAPVIQQYETENIIPSLIDFNWLSKLIGISTNKGTNLHFEIQSFTLAEWWLFSIFSLDLSSWSVELGSTDNNWRWSSMIPDWHVKPVFVKSILWSSNNWSNVEGMCSWWVKVSVITNFDRYMQLNILDFVHQLRLQSELKFNSWIWSEQILKGKSGLNPVWSAKGHEWVKIWFLEDFVFKFGEEYSIEQSMIFHGSEINNPISNSGTTSCHVDTIFRREYTKGNIFQWKFWVWVNVDERNLTLLLHSI